MPYAVALAVLVRGLVALALCLLASPLAKPIVNLVATGVGWFDRSIAWLTNKAIDLGIQFTKWLAPEFEQSLKPLVNYIHHLGQYSHDTAFSIYRNAVAYSNFANWVANTYVPNQFKAWTGHAVDTTIVKVRLQPFSKAQLRTLENTVAHDLARRHAATIPIPIPKAWPKVGDGPKKWRAWLGLTAGVGALTLPGSVAWERNYAKEQGKVNKHTHSRLKRLEKLLGATAAAALVTAGLAKLGLGWMPKCRNLKHIGKSFCGADLSSLIGLFGGLALITGGFSIVTLAEEMLAIEKQMVNVIAGAFSELDGLSA